MYENVVYCSYTAVGWGPLYCCPFLRRVARGACITACLGARFANVLFSHSAVIVNSWQHGFSIRLSTFINVRPTARPRSVSCQARYPFNVKFMFIKEVSDYLPSHLLFRGSFAWSQHSGACGGRCVYHSTPSPVRVCLFGDLLGINSHN